MTRENKTSAADGIMLGIHLDVGHSSIGWSVTETSFPVIFRGCGTVLFPKDGCLASDRRANRRQRRHIRSTRHRISRMRVLLAFLGVMTERDLNLPGGAWPWKIAAEVLAQGRTLTWPELWDVIRWYAHNRGYDNNELWGQSRSDEDDKETRESVDNARNLMARHHTSTMAETVCAVLELAPGGEKCASIKRYKASKASFPREVVVAEVRRILQAHIGKLSDVTDDLIRVLTGSATEDPAAWQAVPCPGIVLPKRYAGGLLFGQLVPRFDNRIIGRCPISGEKKPMKSCPEFLEYRWAMLMSNVRVARADMPQLTVSEREFVTARLRAQGYFTGTSFNKAVKEATGIEENNIDDMMRVPDADNALELYPALREVKGIARLWETVPESIQRLVLKRLSKGKSLKLSQIREWLSDPAEFDKQLNEMRGKAKKKTTDPLDKVLKADFPSGRAPYSREIMRQAVAEVMAGQDPRMEGGVLYGASLAKCLGEADIDHETNNHLVRHRLRVMRRLVEDIVKEYADGNKSMIDNVTIELNREVKDLSGKTVKEIAADLNLRIKTHSAAAEYAAKALDVPKHKLGGSLIRKVRIAMDLDWTCPYTLQQYDIHQLVNGSVDLDHIIPRSKRTSDSLDSLVITFKAINAWKSNSTALDFVQANGGSPVPGMPNLSIISPKRYEEFVAQLKQKRMPHRDDQKRRDNRCERLMTRICDEGAEKGFTPRDLTVSSHLVTLASAVLRDIFSREANPPVIHSVPGRVTKEVRIGFDLMGMLAPVNPLVLNEDDTLKTKTEIRDVTHLHHAVDAVTLGLATQLIPVDGEVWGMMLKRNLNPHERTKLEKVAAFQFDGGGRPSLRKLDSETVASIRQCLSECRVATHIPSSKHGATLEKTIWGVVAEEKDGVVLLRQRSRDEKTNEIKTKPAKESAKRLLGINPRGPSKLKAIKGAIVISDNFGVALDPEPEVIPYHQVWRRIGEIKKRNNGVIPRVLRNGMLIRVAQGAYAGIWKLFSIKAARVGILVDMGAPDVVTLRNKTPGHRINVMLKTLLRDGLEICATGYTGVARNVAPPD